MRGRVEVAEKSSDGCNLPGESVNGRVAGVMVLGGHNTSRSVPNGVHIWKQKKVPTGWHIWRQKRFEMGDPFGVRTDLRISGEARF